MDERINIHQYGYKHQMDKERYIRWGAQERRSVSKRDGRCFFFSLLKVQGGVRKGGYYTSFSPSVVHKIWRKPIKICSIQYPGFCAESYLWFKH